MALLINGRFLTRPITGVQRYGRCLLAVIAKQWPDARVIIPKAEGIHGIAPDLEVQRAGVSKGHVWEQLELPRAVDAGDVLLSPANTGPVRVARHVAVIHDLAFLHHPEWFNKRFAWWYTQLIPRVAHRAAHVITVSGTMKNDVQDRLGIPAKRCSVVPPFVSADPLGGNVAEMPSEAFTLCVASRDPRKGTDALAAWYSGQQDLNHTLVLAGRAHRAFKPPTRTHSPMVSYVEDLDDSALFAHYRKTVALIQPSLYEGFGLPILEAMSVGCPVIANDLPVFREEFGDAPVFMDMRDPSTLSNALSLARDPSERARIIARGHLAAERFNQARTTSTLRAVLDPLLNG